MLLKALFCVIIVLWVFVGFCGVLHCKENRTNYEMITFMTFAPFIPFIAKICGFF